MHVSPRNPTRHILAGLAAAVGAVPPPYQARQPGAAAPSLDFAWATGHHPFGPFANASSFSQTTVGQHVESACFGAAELARCSLVTSALLALRGSAHCRGAAERVGSLPEVVGGPRGRA